MTRMVLIMAAGVIALAQNPHPMGMGMGMGRPIPARVESQQNPLTPAKIALGRMLFFEKRLSRAGDVSCNTCHDLRKYGVDGTSVSTGHAGQRGSRNAPTVYNSAAHFVQFWDGRAATIEEQAKGPILNPVEMAMPSAAAAVKAIAEVAGYRRPFADAFPGENDPVTFDNIAKAIGAFERTLQTSSRWDSRQLTAEEFEGHHLFMHSGCASCHFGPYFGATSFQKLGKEKAWPDAKDPGRFAVTKDEKDRMVFKVPSLRNVEKTAPYFHDGSVARLEDAVRLMSRHQLGREMSDNDARLIVAWFKALTGDLPPDAFGEPALPR